MQFSDTSCLTWISPRLELFSWGKDTKFGKAIKYWWWRQKEWCDMWQRLGERELITIEHLFFLNHKQSCCLYKTWRWEMQMWDVTVFILLVYKTVELPAFSYKCLQALKSELEFFLETQPFQTLKKKLHFTSALHTWMGWWIIFYSPVFRGLKTCKHAEKREWGQKVFF